ncbi:transaldolase family protein [Rapidithrix thailandica]|uniref:Transaldolase family protein n=1 Tax=Rapidithrix thailandica TaxID=413964 RepID=A0AAW9SKJ2_9BACT
MELYLDSADINEIEEAFKLGFLAGLTTTPTFMHRHGITDIDGTIVKLSKMVPVLQVEALGETAEEIYKEAQRLLGLGLEKEKTVFKIPVSMEGVKACHMLTSEGIKVNIHLVYTLQQAYMAMNAGATYVCVLVGRWQDQGHDSLTLVEQCVEAVDRFGYDSKIMFSSVRHPEHVRNAIELGAHTCTVPWKVMKLLTENNFTTVGTEQFFEHTKLMTVTVNQVVNRSNNPVVSVEDTMNEAIFKMTESGFGCVSVVKGDNELVGVFTDGDLRRLVANDGKIALQKKMGELEYKSPITIESSNLLNEASTIFHKTGVDTIVVTENSKVIGMLDIQDLN